MKRATRGLVGLVVGCCLAVALAPVAAAQQSDGAPPPNGSTEAPVPSDAILAAIRLGEVTERLVRLDAQIAEVRQEEDALRVDLDAIEERLTEHRARVDELIDRVQSRAAVVYSRGGSGPLAPLTIDSRQDLQSGRSYTEAVNSVDDGVVEELRTAQEELTRDRDRRLVAIDELRQTRDRLLASRAEAEALRVQEQLLIERWGVVSVMGRSRLTPAQITAWFESTGIRPSLPPGLAIADLAELFVEEGDLAGVKGDVAFAQSVVETGSFTEFKGYNFSGIGVCDSCTGGYLFGAARDGVRAQVQLLRSYADPESRAADLPVPLSPVLYGSDAVEAARRFDTFFKKGVAPVWNQMGGGNWATDPTYAGKVLRVYARMLAFAEGS